MEWVETTGKTLDEAREAALDELGVDEQDAEFEVLSEPKLGLFGRIRTEGRVRARVRPSVPRAKEDRRDRKRRSRSDGRSRLNTPGGESNADSVEGRVVDVDGPVGETRAATADATAPSTGGRSTRSQRAARPAPGRTDAEGADPGSAGPDPTAPTVPAPGGRRNPSRGHDRAAAAAVETPSPTSATLPQPAADDDAPAAARPRRRRSGAAPRDTDPAGSRQTPAWDDGGEATVDVALEEQGQVAEEFLVGLLAGFELEASIRVVQPDDDTVELNLTGDGLGLLIGSKGATLLAIQELTRAAVQRKTGAGNGRIHVDVSGYRQQRSEALGRFATKVATDVVASGTRIALEPMSAADRKVVHDTLTEVEGVETISEGEDPRRRVVVLPAGS